MNTKNSGFWIDGLSWLRYAIEIAFAVLRLSILAVVSSMAFCASLYNIQPLAGADPTAAPFLVNYLNLLPENTQFFPGSVNGNPAVGTWSNSLLSVQPLQQIEGQGRLESFRVLSDGSAIGYTSPIIEAGPGPGSPPIYVAPAVLNHWVNGVPSKVEISDPNLPSAVLSATAFNVNGDIVGSHRHEGTSSVFRFNLFSKSFEVIPVDLDGDIFFIAYGVSSEGHILIQTFDRSTGIEVRQLRLLDPASSSWSEFISTPDNSIALEFFLNSRGLFAANFSVFFNESESLPYYFDGSTLRPLYTSQAPRPPLPPGRTISTGTAGINRDGVAIGNLNERMGIFEDGEFIELFPLIQNPEGWSRFILSPDYFSGVNDLGEIVGVGRYNGVETSFILTPIQPSEVPEPNTAAVAAATLTCLYIVRRSSYSASKCSSTVRRMLLPIPKTPSSAASPR